MLTAAAACGTRLAHGRVAREPRQQLARPVHRAWRTLSTAAAALDASGPASEVTPDTDVEDAIRAACQQLRKPFPQDAVAALQAEWFTTAGELAGLPDDTARSLGVPLRLKHAVAEMLGGGGGGGDGAAPPAALGEATRLPAEAERALDSLVGGGSGSSSSSGLDANSAAQSAAAAAAAASDDDTDGSPLAEAVAATVAASSEADGAWDQAHLPIEERRCPAHQMRRPFSTADAPRVTKRGKADAYALREAELPPALAAEFDQFHRFCTQRFFGAQAEPISDVTARKYQDHLRGMLGWLHRHRGLPLDELSLRALLPSSGREGVSLVFDYLLWLQQERSVSVRTEGVAIRSATAAAKFLFHSESQVNPGRGERPYGDLEVVKELRAMSNACSKRSKVAPRAADEELKWLSWPEYLQLVGELRKECAALRADGSRRSTSAVAWSLQRWLIFAIFSCVPDRQRTLRELEVGRTLLKDREGRWVIRHGPGDYKTGRAYGERPPLQISPHIYPELEAFMGKWRAELNPKHNLLFTQPNGEPLTDKSLYKLFWTTAFRLTGKKCNPHLVRDSIVTYLRGSNASERELEALAIYMGHSVAMQRDTYDRRTKEQKVEPAVELLASLNLKAMGGGGGGASGSDTDAA